MIAHDDFICRIVEQPHDATLRLIAADWLEERGEGERAEFIRLQCRIADLEELCSCGSCVGKRGGGQHTNGPCAIDQEREELADGSSRQAFLRLREQELLADNATKWRPGPGTAWIPNHESALAGCEVGHNAMLMVFRRGFIEEVHCRLVDWWGERCRCQDAVLSRDAEVDGGGCTTCNGTGCIGGYGPSIVAQQPILSVRLTELPTWHELPDDIKTSEIQAAYETEINAILGRRPIHNQEQAIRTTLSNALITWARREADPPLPELEESLCQPETPQQ